MKTKIADPGKLYFLTVPHLWVRKVLLLSGIASALIWIGTDLLASLSYEGYNFPFDPISGLSAVDAPTKAFVVSLMYVYIILKAAFSLGVWNSAGQNRSLRITAGLLFTFVLTDIASSIFPWNPAEPLGTFENVMHSLFAGGIAVLLIFLTIGFGAYAEGKWFRFYSYGTLLIMFVLGALPLVSDFKIAADQIPEWFGAGERINAYGYMLWMTMLAAVLLRSQQRIE